MYFIRRYTKIFLLLITLLPLHSYGMKIIVTGDGATAGESAVDVSCSLAGEQSFTSDGSRTIYTSEKSYSASTSIKLTAPEGKTGFGSFGGIINFPNCSEADGRRLVKGDEIWTRVRLYIPSDWEFNSGRNKFLRYRVFNGEGDNAKSEGYNDLYIDGNPDVRNWQPFHFIFEGDPSWFSMGDESSFFERDAWTTVEMYLKLDNKKKSEGGDARVRVWINGLLIGDTGERKTLKTATSYIESLNFFTYYGNETSPKNQSIYIDDLIVTTESPLTKDVSGNRYIGLGEPSTRPTPDHPPIQYFGPKRP